MAQSNLISNAEIRPVYYQVGKFVNDNRPKYVKAPVVVLLINNEEYVMPVCGPSDARDFQNILSNYLYDIEQVLARQDFGFESGEDIIVGEHELGSGKDGSWKGFHKFGNI